MDKLNDIFHTVEYYKNELDIAECYNVGKPLNTLSQMKEAKYTRPQIIWLHWYEMIINGKSIETERRLMVSWGWGVKKGGDSR